MLSGRKATYYVHSIRVEGGVMVEIPIVSSSFDRYTLSRYHLCGTVHLCHLCSIRQHSSCCDTLYPLLCGV